MKHITTFCFFLLSVALSAQDIADVSVSGSGRVTVRDANNNEIATRYLGNGEELAGFSSTIVVVQSSSGRVTVYNQKFEEIASHYLGNGERIKAVTGNYVIIKSSSGRVTTYDRKFQEISSRYE